MKKLNEEFDFAKLLIKGRASRGNLVTKNQITKIQFKSKGSSTIGGKAIWFDNDISRLNEDSRGTFLGKFEDGEHILAICKDGTYYTTSFDLSNRYQGDLMKVEKLSTDKTYSVLYWDDEVKSFYIKRFSFEVSDNNVQSFIGEAKGSYLVAISEDKYPQLELIFGGKHIGRDPEIIDVEQFIGKKGIKAKGKKVTYFETSEIRFIEPLVKEEEKPAEDESEIELNLEENSIETNIIADSDNDDIPDFDEPIELTLF